jgi:DNA-binding transcriptional MerR regulator
MTFDEVQFLIHELADQVGVTTRTIRYYIAEGLLPAPTSRGRYAYYQAEYLERIRLIKALQADFLPLREIRRVMEQVKTDEIAALLGSEEKRRRFYKELPNRQGYHSIAEDNTAAGYIQNILAPGIVVQEEKPMPAALSQSASAPLPRQRRPVTGQTGWRQHPVADGVTLSIREDVELRAGEKLHSIMIALRQMFRLL